MKPLESAQLDVITGPETLEAIHSTLERFWDAHPVVPEAVRMRVSLAVAEIGTNIVKYAGDGGPVRMRMELLRLPDAVQVSFRDDGSPFGLDLDSLNMPDALAESGRGLPLARSVLSRLTYVRGDAGNHWLLLSQPF